MLSYYGRKGKRVMIQRMRKNSVANKTMMFAALVFYLILLSYISPTVQIQGIIILCATVRLLFKTKDNRLLFLMSIIIAFMNYSIVLGEYIFPDKLSVPMVEVKTESVYRELLIVFLIFISIFVFAMEKHNDTSLHLKPRDNIFLFVAFIATCYIALMFDVNRADLSGQTYTVRVGSLFEYCKIFLLFAYFYSGEKLSRKIITVATAIVIILTDLKYGGRISTLQIILMLLITIFYDKLTVKRVLVGCAVGIVLINVASVYRNSYALENFDLSLFIRQLIDDRFVNDTATFAYYSSATHIAASNIATSNIRLKSLFDFIVSVFVGNSTNGTGDVSIIAKKYFYYVPGGGYIFSHYYFWLGKGGVILGGIILVSMLNGLINKIKLLQIGGNDNSLPKLILATIVITVPRWYVYSPNQLFRPILLVCVIYLLTNYLGSRRIMFTTHR